MRSSRGKDVRHGPKRDDRAQRVHPLVPQYRHHSLEGGACPQNDGREPLTLVVVVVIVVVDTAVFFLGVSLSRTGTSVEMRSLLVSTSLLEAPLIKQRTSPKVFLSSVQPTHALWRHSQPVPPLARPNVSLKFRATMTSVGAEVLTGATRR